MDRVPNEVVAPLQFHLPHELPQFRRRRGSEEGAMYPFVTTIAQLKKWPRPSRRQVHPSTNDGVNWIWLYPWRELCEVAPAGPQCSVGEKCNHVSVTVNGVQGLMFLHGVTLMPQGPASRGFGAHVFAAVGMSAVS